MSEPFLGEIKLVPYTFAPKGWAFCAGQILSINENQALYSLLGTFYGGDGRTSYGLPDLRGRVPVGSSTMGTGPGLSPFPLGTRYGFETVSLNVNQLANHTHNNSLTVSPSPITVSVEIPGDSNAGTKGSPATDRILAANSNTSGDIYSKQADNTTLKPFNAVGTVTPAVSIANASVGSSAHIENRQPFTALNYVIAMQGIYPSRN